MNQTVVLCFIIASILFAQCLSATNSSSPIQDLYRSLCKGKNGVKLTSVSQIQQLAQLTRDVTTNDCPAIVINSIKSLNAAVIRQSGNICSKKKANLMRDFYIEYVDDKKNKAPKGLRKFFAAYGMKLSQVCRRRMINSITDSNKILSDKDFEFVKDWTSEEGPIGKFLSDPADYEDLVIPENLGHILKSGQEQTFIQVSTKSRFDEMKVFCQRRLQPFYEKLISPLITLNNIGFNYQADTTEPRDQATNKLVYQWYRILFACENLKNIVVAFDVTLNPFKTVNAPSRMVQILTNEEVQDKLREGDKTWLAAMKEEQQGLERYPEIEPIVYKPAKDDAYKSDKLGDIILDTNDKKLLYSVNHYKPHHKQSVFKLMAKATKYLKTSKTTKSKITDATQLMVSLNDYQHHLEHTDNQGVASDEKRRGRHDDKLALGLLVAVIALAVGGFVVAKG